MRHAAPRALALLILGMVLGPLLLTGATLAHTHDGAGIGLYNQEHDLVLMGALGSVAPLPALVVAVAVVVVALLICAPALAIHSSARRLEVSRAAATGAARAAGAVAGESTDTDEPAVADRPAPPTAAVRALSAARKRPAALRHGGDRRLHRQHHAAQRPEVRHRHLRRAREPLLP